MSLYLKKKKKLDHLKAFRQLKKETHWNGGLDASRFVVSVVQMPSDRLLRVNKYQAVTQSGSRPTTAVMDSQRCQWDGEMPEQEMNVADPKVTILFA